MMAAEAAVMNPEGLGRPDLDPEGGALFHRRIEFHVARKPFNGFGVGNSNSNSNSKNSNGFKLVTLNPKSSEPHKASGSGKACESSEHPDTGLDPELSFRITFRRIGAGLRNLGNTCFLNSVLQCLTYTEPLAAYLQSGKHQYACRTAGFCALCAIQKHVSRALQSSGRILEPKDLVSNLRCISRSFRNARQEDAHEYMVNLLESMHRCCLPSGIPSESPTAYEKSLVHKIFGGRLRSQVKCMQCSFCSNKFDPFLDLSLEIVKADSLHKALAHFTAKEHLDGGAKQYQCQQCNQKVKALKQLTIHKAPHVLTIHLKRFGSHVSGQKIDKKIAFGSTLDLKPFVTGPYDGDLKYTLYGVLVHAGWSTHSGHYYCFVRTSSGMWYSLDDNQVVQVNERKVLEQKAYMLFYVRDRKDLVAKKQVDLKENMVMNAIRIGTYPKFNLESKDKMQNGSVERIADSSFSAALSDGDKAMVFTSEQSLLINSSSQKLNCRTDIGGLAFEGASPSKPSVVQPVDSVKDGSTTARNSVCHQADAHSTVNVSGVTSLKAGQTAKIVARNNPSSVAQDISVFPKILSQGFDSLNNKESSVVAMPTIYDKDVANQNKNELTSEPQNKSALSASSGEVRNIDGISSEMVGVSRSVESKIVDTLESNLGAMNHQSKMLSDVPSTTARPSCGIARRKRTQLKGRKKLFKLQVASMSLSSNIIFGGAISLQKKKNKRKSHHSSETTSPGPNHSLKETDSSSFLPSSESTTFSSASTGKCMRSKRKRSKDEIHDKDKNLEIIKDNGIGSSYLTDDEPSQKMEQNGTNVSSEGQLHRSSENHRSEMNQNCVRGFSAGDLEETIVARWDGFDVSLSERTEANGGENAQIGYIGDEWDEDYDRGKRKKIRGPKITFGGPNLFQEFATRNAKRKKAKLNRSRSENQPFRI